MSAARTIVGAAAHPRQRLDDWPVALVGVAEDRGIVFDQHRCVGRDVKRAGQKAMMGGEQHGPAACRGAGGERLPDRAAVNRTPVADRAKRLDAEHPPSPRTVVRLQPGTSIVQ